MKKHLLFLLLCLAIFPQKLLAIDFTVDNIGYNIIGTTNEVSVADVPFSGALTIPSTVTYKSKTYDVVKLEDYVLRNHRTTTFTIGSKLRDLGNLSSSECSNFTSFVVDTENPNFASNDGVLFNKAMTTLIMFPCGSGRSSYSVPQTVKTIQGESFCYSNLISVEFGNSVTYLGAYAFAGCDNLVNLTLGDSVKSMGYRTFRYCDNLESATLGESLIEIPEDAFDACKKLRKVVIPKSVGAIARRAFTGCSALDSILVKNPYPPVVNSNAFNNVSRLATVIVPCGALSRYSNADGWSNFLSIEADTNFSFSFDVISQNEVMGSVNIITEPDCGINAVVEAIANYGYSFVKWNDNNTDNPRSVEVNQDTLITAEFAPNKYVINVTCNPEHGVIQGDIGQFDYLTEHIYKAVANYGYTFAGWSDGVIETPRSLILTQDTTIEALFDINYYPVVFLNWNGDILSDQSVAYNHAAEAPEVPIREGYVFIGWSSDIEHIKTRTFVIALYDNTGVDITYKTEDGSIISTEPSCINLPDAPIITGKTFAGWLTETADNTNGIVLRATYTIDNPTTSGDVTVNPTSTTAGVSFPYITGALTYVLIIRDLFGHVVCKIMFNANGQLLGIAFAPGRNNAPQQTQSEGFHFTVEGLTPGTTYEYEFVAHDETDQIIETLAGSFTTTGEATDVNNVSSSSAPRKVINEGNVFILRGEKTYTLTGAEVK